MRKISPAAGRFAKFGIADPETPDRHRRATLAFFCALGAVTCAAAVFATDIRAVLAFSEENAAAFFRKERARQAAAHTPQYTARPLTVVVPAGGENLRKKTTENKKKADKARTEDATAATGSRSVCVRLCDGYHFPVANAPASGGVAAHEAICSATCPGAPTRLYVIPAGADDIGRAYSARGGRPYSALPVAFRHTGTRDLTCSCRRNDEPQMSLVSLYRDFTLRSGDAVMTDKGFRIFRGARQWPYKARDFTAVRTSKLRSAQRRLLQRMERASALHTNASLRERPQATPRTIATPAPVLGPFPVSRRHAGIANPREERIAQVQIGFRPSSPP